jgi:toxin ParE1/3/4
MKYNLFLDPRAIDDIQSAIDYYNDQSNGLGEKFEKHLNTYILSISKNPFSCFPRFSCNTLYTPCKH